MGPSKEGIFHINDFPVGTDPSMFPNFEMEGCYLDPGRKTMKISDLLKFETFDSHGIVRILDTDLSIKIVRIHQELVYRVRGLDAQGKQYEVSTVEESNLVHRKEEQKEVRVCERERSEERETKERSSPLEASS